MMKMIQNIYGIGRTRSHARGAMMCLLVCALGLIVPMNLHAQKTMAGDTVSIGFDDENSRSNSIRYLTVPATATTGTRVSMSAPVGSQNDLWVVVQEENTTNNTFRLKNLRTGLWLKLNADRDISMGDNAYRMSMEVVDGKDASSAFGIEPTGTSDYAANGKADVYFSNTHEGTKYYLTYTGAYNYEARYFIARTTTSTSKVHIERWSKREVKSVQIDSNPKEQVFIWAADDEAAKQQAITVNYTITVRDSTYIYNVPGMRDGSNKTLIDYTLNIYSTPQALREANFVPSWYWNSNRLNKNDRESKITAAMFDNAGVTDVLHQEQARTAMTMSEPKETGTGWQITVTPNGHSPLNIKNNDNFTDFLCAEVQQNGHGVVASYSTIIVRKAYHYDELDNRLSATVMPRYWNVAASTDLKTTYKIELALQNGYVLYDIEGNKIEEKVDATGVAMKDVTCTFTPRTEDLTADVTWLDITPDASKSALTVTADQNSNAVPRRATIVNHFAYNTADGKTHEAVVYTSVVQHGTNAEGKVALEHYKGVGNDKLGDDGRQPVHTIEKTIYYTAGEEIELRLNEPSFIGYMRWYDYNTNKDPQYDKDGKQISNFWVQFPYIIRNNGATQNFVSINDDGITSHGVYATYDLLKDNRTQQNNSGTPPPIIRAWTDGQAHDIACDVSAYVDYEITSEKVKEPTLSYRQIFHFLPAKAMADTLKNYKKPDATSGKKDVFFEEYHYIAPKGKQVYLSTKFAHRKSYHQSDFCYYFYNTRDQLRRLGVGGVTGVWHKDGQSMYVSDNDYEMDYFLVSSNDIATHTYELHIPRSATGDADILLARFVVDFVDPAVYGPSKNELISDDTIKRYYIPLAKRDFNYNKPGTKDITYYNGHLPWEESTYGYAYVQAYVQGVVKRPTNVDGGYFPYYGEYCLLNRVDKQWAVGEQHGGAENGYCLYVDGMQQAGLVASISTDVKICSGQQLYCYAWVCNSCPLSEQRGSLPIFRFNVQGRNKNADGTYGEWEDVGIFFAGAIERNSGWQQVLFPLVSANDYDESRVCVYNFAQSNSANDFLVDDICLFASRLPLGAYQATTSCLSEKREVTITTLDYSALTGDHWQCDPIYFQIYNKTENKPIQARYYKKDKPAEEGETDYGYVIIPEKDYDPSKSGDEAYREKYCMGADETKLVYNSVSQLIDTLSAHMDRDEKQNGAHANDFTMKVYIKTRIDGQDRWVIYIGHILPKEKLDTKNEYEIRTADLVEELDQPLCARRVALPLFDKTNISFGGETNPTKGQCANDYYPVEVLVTNTIDGGTGKVDTLRAAAKADWLIGHAFDDCYDPNSGSTATAEQKAEADAAFAKQYYYDRGKVQDALRELRMKTISRGDSVMPNPNALVSEVSKVQREFFVDEKNYDIIVDLCQKGYLTLYKDRQSFYMTSGDVLRYWIFPIAGTAVATLPNGTSKVLEGCDDPTYVKVQVNASDYVLNPSPVKKDEMTEVQKVAMPTVRVTQSEVNKSFRVPISDISDNVMLGWDSCKVTATNDPNVATKIGSKDFSMHYSQDKVLQDHSADYYKSGDYIVFTPVNQAHVDAMKYRHNNPKSGDPEWGEGQPGMQVVNTDTMRAGYEYTMSIQMLDRQSHGTSVSEGCKIGFAFFKVVVLPDTMVWTPTVSNEWGDDRNWRGIVNGEIMDHGYAPIAGTKVIIPELNHAELYPYITNEVLYPMDAHYSPNTCHSIHFHAHARMWGQHRLNYTNAYVDMPTRLGKWYSMSAPLQDMYAGDMFIPHDATGNILETKDEFAVSEFKGRRDRNAPYAFWISYYDKAGQILHEDGSTSSFSTATADFSPSNALDEKLEPGHGYKLLGFGPKGTSGTMADIRLPKHDAKYFYYNQSGQVTERYVDLERTNAHRLAYGTDNTIDGTLTIRLTNNKEGGKQFLLGNPTMAYLDMAKLLDAHQDLLEPHFQYLDGSTWQTIKYDVSLSYSARFVVPMQSVMIETKEPQKELTITIKPEFLAVNTLEPGQSHDTPEEEGPTLMQHRKPGHMWRNEVMAITAYSKRGTAHATLAAMEFGNNGYEKGEDVLFISSGVEAAVGSNVATSPVNIYTLAGDKALMADIRSEIGVVPVGFLIADRYRTDSMTVAFHLSSNWISECYFCDAETGKKQRIYNDTEIKIATPANHTMRYYIQGPAKEPGEDTPTEENSGAWENNSVGVTAFSNAPETLVVTAQEAIAGLQVYDMAGRLMWQHAYEAGSPIVTASVPSGMALVEVRLESGFVVRKKVLVE